MSRFARFSQDNEGSFDQSPDTIMGKRSSSQNVCERDNTSPKKQEVQISEQEVEASDSSDSM